VRNRNRLWRGEREIVEHTPIRHGLRFTIVAGHGSGGLEPLREQFARFGSRLSQRLKNSSRFTFPDNPRDSAPMPTTDR
jgi:hypothetical protein